MLGVGTFIVQGYLTGRYALGSLAPSCPPFDPPSGDLVVGLAPDRDLLVVVAVGLHIWQVGFNNGACRTNFNRHRHYAGW